LSIIDVVGAVEEGTKLTQGQERQGHATPEAVANANAAGNKVDE
jgi:hypothetical protein